MYFLDDSLFPENQEKLVITAAPYGPEWEPADFPEDIPVTMDQHVQQAVDCWEAGATRLHIPVRELDGKGSKRMSQFNELLRRLREAVPEMILQVGGSVSFAPEGDGADAKWLSDDARPMPPRGGRGGPQMAVRRRPAHARRAGPEAGPGDDRDQHLADEHRRADDRLRH